MAFNPNRETSYQSPESSGDNEEEITPVEINNTETVITKVQEGLVVPTEVELRQEIDSLAEQIKQEAHTSESLRSGSTVAEVSAFTAGATLGANFEMLSSEEKAALMSVATTQNQNLAEGFDGGVAGGEGVELPPIENSAGNWIRNNPGEVRETLNQREIEMQRLNTLRGQVRDELKQQSFFARLRTVGLASEEEWVNSEALRRLNRENQ